MLFDGRRSSYSAQINGSPGWSNVTLASANYDFTSSNVHGRSYTAINLILGIVDLQDGIIHLGTVTKPVSSVYWVIYEVHNQPSVPKHPEICSSSLFLSHIQQLLRRSSLPLISCNAPSATGITAFQSPAQVTVLKSADVYGFG